MNPAPAANLLSSSRSARIYRPRRSGKVRYTVKVILTAVTSHSTDPASKVDPEWAGTARQAVSAKFARLILNAWET
jgi:hypothetical protein